MQRIKYRLSPLFLVVINLRTKKTLLCYKSKNVLQSDLFINFFVYFLFYDNFTFMSNMFFQLLAWELMG